MENFEQFKQRVSFIKGGNMQSEIITNSKLCDKIDENGKMKDFYGDTVVFLLPKEVKKELLNIQLKLYCHFWEFLANPIREENLHLTLHDLSNSADESLIKGEMDKNIDGIWNTFKNIRLFKHHEFEGIRMRTTCLCNMVNTSIVLGLEPVDEVSYQKLFSLYEMFDSVQKLDYLYTPHITLAYYKPGVIDNVNVNRLKAMFDELNKNSFELNLNSYMLVYQTFTNMDKYVECLIP